VTGARAVTGVDRQVDRQVDKEVDSHAGGHIGLLAGERVEGPAGRPVGSGRMDMRISSPIGSFRSARAGHVVMVARA